MLSQLKELGSFLQKHQQLLVSPLRREVPDHHTDDGLIISLGEAGVMVITTTKIITFSAYGFVVITGEGFERYEWESLNEVPEEHQEVSRLAGQLQPILLQHLLVLDKLREKKLHVGEGEDYLLEATPKLKKVLLGEVPPEVAPSEYITHHQIAYFYQRAGLPFDSNHRLARKEVSTIAKALIVTMEVGWMPAKNEITFTREQVQRIATLSLEALTELLAPYFQRRAFPTMYCEPTLAAFRSVAKLIQAGGELPRFD